MELLASRLNDLHRGPNNPYAPLRHHAIQTHDRGNTIWEHLRQHTRIQSVVMMMHAAAKYRMNGKGN